MGHSLKQIGQTQSKWNAAGAKNGALLRFLAAWILEGVLNLFRALMKSTHPSQQIPSKPSMLEFNTGTPADWAAFSLPMDL
jgi:hypothetical protein